ncbi:MAG: efflux RND transporter periplasmic adaptor subunit, partial [Planctomycetia bacterium]|nr:efflux RND transporter periplasmic adaptor subunit [Planctomycetia bacterium]
MRTGQISLIVLFAVALPFVSGCDFLDSIFKRKEIEVPKAAVLKIDVMKPQMRKVTDYEEFTGETAAIDEVEIKAQVSGYLSRVAFTEGSEVKKGDLLFEIEPEVYKAVRDSAKAELDSLSAKLPRLENEVTRYLELLQTKAVSQSDYEGAVSDRDECRAKAEKAKAELQRAEIDLKYTKIISPIDGFISRKLISEGNLVQTHSNSNSSLLAKMVSLDPIYVMFNVDESTYLRLASIGEEKFKADPKSIDRAQKIEFRLTDEPAFIDADGKPLHTGIIQYSDPYMNQASGTVLLRATCKNPRRVTGLPYLLPGLVVHVRIPVTEDYNALLIPEEAIGTEQGIRFVYVINSKNIVQVRHLKLGPLQADNMRVVRSGLKEGDVVA